MHLATRCPLTRHGRFVALASVLLTNACTSLPSSGPTGHQISTAATSLKNTLPFRIIEVTDFAALPPLPALPAVFAPDYHPHPTNLIGPGDTLDISVYETGVTLFKGAATGSQAGGDLGHGVQVEKLSGLRVDDQGYIQLPYVGRMQAGGRTSSELEGRIRNAYRGLSENPQILVAIRDPIANSIIVSGDVLKPGRLVLSTNTETLSDVIALAGGYRNDAKDLTARVQRRDQVVEIRLADAFSSRERDMRIYPGDRVALVRAPRTYAVMGAPGKVEQMGFSGPSISLAEALAQSGGANPNLGDPKAIFVFRSARDAQGVEVPTAYHLNMMNASGYFLAQRFAMQDKDVLYVGNAAANQPSKMIQLISQVFSPLLTVWAISRAN